MSYFDKANELYNNKKYEKAISMYTKAVEMKENEAASLYNTAVCFIKLKDFQKAIATLHCAIRLKRESSYFFNLGYCHAMLNNNNKALNYFNTAWALNHGDKECEKAISIILETYYNKNKTS
ncbi:tetratricopeptide repeat family protein [Clostridium argentinense CDC 2741]|uniref:Tetratricopeptide repeat family protein n=1 Tax=Clostridium argentinense CDC 2741 TaxID=1418104 RepID=A0A0C1TUA8_9CLOT|nr:tetratricopeptide repeat protein [Clostridium argentinense]ARC84132.1 hypothetical protein RSJ17_06070 [Clostridium argentinense]KIE44349.1 tetratricopeptide repeat family protein [Clostridium argentinense CDC 2741]NFF39264.1 tetratricopeptide repeat protein [Clostridium argentinense]NFP51260.1 tetratricopeptide repeat protein [Clostridium argentinense]NFP73833.1 tetratricopeptide repeat protein [Clostridium argentinense]